MARPRLIDRGAILDAAVSIADEQGLDAVTMHAVAARLGVTAMALYRHVDGKDGLLDGVVERLLDEVELPSTDEPWDRQIMAMGGSLRAVAHRHPGAFALLLRLPARTPAALAARDRVIAALTAGGVDPGEVHRVERIVSTLILGWAASEVGGRFRQHAAAELDDDQRALELFVRAGLAPFLGEGPGAARRPRAVGIDSPR